MESHQIACTRSTKMTRAYIARWIRPMPLKPFHPHDLSIHLEKMGSLAPLAPRGGRH